MKKNQHQFPTYPSGRKEEPTSVGDRLSRDSGKTFRSEMSDYTAERLTGQKPERMSAEDFANDKNTIRQYEHPMGGGGKRMDTKPYSNKRSF